MTNLNKDKGNLHNRNQVSAHSSGLEATCKLFESAEAFSLESGLNLPSLAIAYHTFGTLNNKRDNVIWIVHALTANSNPLEWWPEMVGPDKFIDPSQHYIVCANAIGSAYGSTSPITVNNVTGDKLYHDFPTITQRDQVNAFNLLRQHLGIEKIKLLVGASLGGQQCLEWSIMFPETLERQLLIATNALHSPWGIAFNESQRMAIRADQTFNQKTDDAGKLGLEVARSIAMLSYRTYNGFQLTQQEHDPNLFDNFKAASYQRYQGLKLANRFNAFSYISLTQSMDSHNIGRNRGELNDVLNSIKVKTYIISIDSDILFPPQEQRFLYENIHDSVLHTISSQFGHDGFLTENAKVGEIVADILNTA
jgi:homoserine O-acetyltransferase